MRGEFAELTIRPTLPPRHGRPALTMHSRKPNRRHSADPGKTARRPARMNPGHVNANRLPTVQRVEAADYLPLRGSAAVNLYRANPGSTQTKVKPPSTVVPVSDHGASGE